jgi:hypothetical protein
LRHFAQPSTEFAARAKATWARLIRKVYEADPLKCPKCKGPMRAIGRTEHRSGITAALNWHRTPATGALIFLFLIL